MNNQNKWNKELLYSITFLIAGILWYWFNPVDIIRNLIDLSPNALDIRYRLLDWGVYPILYHVLAISIIGLFFFLLCSIYVGILSLKKASVEGEKKIFGFIPKNLNIQNTPAHLAVLLIFTSTAYLLLNVFIVSGLFD